MNKSKGFTIIELIVVIAIIAVLAGIVLINVTKYITTSRDAAIKGDMSTILTNSAVWYDSASTYVGFVSDPSYSRVSSAIGVIKTAPTYAVTTSAFCATAALNSGTSFCVDSTGYKGALGVGKCTSSTFTCQ